ncbi:MAG: DUF2281 domain-containing protein [Candidatus Freyarchaeum deiterrae]
MDSKEMIKREIEQMPDALLEEILDFIRFLRNKKAHEKFEAAILSESSLKKDWLLPEEDEAWQNL